MWVTYQSLDFQDIEVLIEHAFKRMEKIEEVRFTKCATMLRDEPKNCIFYHFELFVQFVLLDK